MRKPKQGEMECRMGDFSCSSQTLDQALAQCPTYGRAREVTPLYPGFFGRFDLFNIFVAVDTPCLRRSTDSLRIATHKILRGERKVQAAY